MSHQTRSAYALGANLAASLFGLQKTALAGPSAGKVRGLASSALPKPPKPPGAAVASVAKDPGTTAVGGLVVKDLASDAFNDAQAHTPTMKGGSADPSTSTEKIAAAHAAALAKHAGLLGAGIAAGKAVAAKVPAIASKATGMLGSKGVQRAAASTAASTAATTAGSFAGGAR